MSGFQREDRYIVVKMSNPTPIRKRNMLTYLHVEGIPTVDGVVVESDWPEFEPVWRMIEARVAGAMSEVCRYKVAKMFTAGGNKITYTPYGPEVVMAEHYNALAAQRDEWLARDAELREELQLVTEERDHAKRNCSAFEDRMGEFQSKHGKAREECQTLQHRLAEAEQLAQRLLDEYDEAKQHARHHRPGAVIGMALRFLASPGCADGEKAE